MKISKALIVGLGGVGLAFACFNPIGDDYSGGSPDAGTNGDGGPSSDAGVNSDAGMSSDAGMNSDAGMEVDAGPCGLGPACVATDRTCLGLTSNAGLTTFGLRMTEIDLTAPLALTTGSLGEAIAVAARVNESGCFSGAAVGSGGFSWLLQFDKTARTLTTGGARPASDPASGYPFDSELLDTFSTAPVVYSNVIPNSAGAFSTLPPASLNLPVFLNASGSDSVLLPLQQLQLSGTVSPGNDCIGDYDSAGLSPQNGCIPDSTHPLFNDGGQFNAYIRLEDADQVLVSEEGQSLCVILSNDSATYGVENEAGTATVCKRDGDGNILFQGDWCSTTNAAATAGCADAVQFAGSFAAGSVLIQ